MTTLRSWGARRRLLYCAAVVWLVAGCGSGATSATSEMHLIETDDLSMCIGLGSVASWASSTSPPLDPSHCTDATIAGLDSIDSAVFDGPSGQSNADPTNGLYFSAYHYVFAVAPADAEIVWDDASSVVSVNNPDGARFQVMTINAGACESRCEGKTAIAGTQIPFTKQQFCSPGNPDDPICGPGA